MLPKLHIRLERWKYNKTFEVYVSNMGHVRNQSGADLAPKIGQNGYMVMHVNGSNPKYILLHRLVMLTWRPTPEAEQLTVDHLDHNKRNNSVYNLEWVTRKENLRRAACDIASAEAQREAGLQTKGLTKLVRKTVGLVCVDRHNHSIQLDDLTLVDGLAKDFGKLTIESGFSLDKAKEIITQYATGKLNYGQNKKYCGLTFVPIVIKERERKQANAE